MPDNADVDTYFDELVGAMENFGGYFAEDPNIQERVSEAMDRVSDVIDERRSSERGGFDDDDDGRWSAARPHPTEGGRSIFDDIDE